MKVLFKLILSIALLGVVFGVSYLKTLPDETGADSTDTALMTEPEAVMAHVDTTKDIEAVVPEKSVPSASKEAIDPQKKPQDKTEEKTQKKIGPTSTSPPKIMAVTSEPAPAKKKDLAKSANKTTKAAKEPDPPKQETGGGDDAKTREEQIVRYFQDKLNALPDDLSSYEKKVAIKEVRDETCDLFHISRAKLNQLAKVNRITYP